MKLPYIKWYVRDAVADLRLLDAATRCVWYEMLWIMAGTERYGYLQRQNRPMTDDEISRLCGLPVDVIRDGRSVLLAENIPSIEPETGIWFSRRMVADNQKRERCAEAGRRGGGSPMLRARADSNASILSEPRTQNPYKGKGAVKTARIKANPKPDDDGFNRFYAEYPKHRARADARRAWDAVRPDIDAVLAALAWQRNTKDWQRDNGQYIPLPATYIRGRRWEDEPAPDVVREQERTRAAALRRARERIIESNLDEARVMLDAYDFKITPHHVALDLVADALLAKYGNPNEGKRNDG